MPPTTREINSKTIQAHLREPVLLCGPLLKAVPSVLVRVFLLALLVSGCTSEVELSINLVTDLVAPIEFDSVHVEVDGAKVGVIEITSAKLTSRLVDLDGLAPSSTRSVSITLQDKSDEPVASTQVLVDNLKDATVTVTLPRSCRNIECPGTASPTAKACLGGTCVESTCLTGSEPSCPQLECTVASDCDAPVATCVAVSCEAGSCIYPQASDCAAGEYCNPDLGCLPLMGCADDCSDNNPCTEDRCVNGDCRHTSLTNDVPCSSGVCLNGLCISQDASLPDASIPDAAVDADASAPSRVTSGLQALYLFANESGTTVTDELGLNDLVIQDVSRVAWLPGALRFEAEALAIGTSASHISTACKTSGELTMEAWVRSELQSPRGPDRIVTQSNGIGERNFMLGVGAPTEEADQVSARLRGDLSIVNGGNGYPEFERSDVIDVTRVQHFVFTHSQGMDHLFVDGVEIATSPRTPDFSTWVDDYVLSVGNEWNLPVDDPPDLRRFHGEIHLIAIYDRALSPAEVQQNFSLGANPELN